MASDAVLAVKVYRRRFNPVEPIFSSKTVLAPEEEVIFVILPPAPPKALL
jgi:hypothetical protein